MNLLLRKLHWISVEQVGIDPFRLASFVVRSPRYLLDLFKFRRQYAGQLSLMPCLHDRTASSGAAQTEYFSQDLLVARKIFDAGPLQHLDIGSRIDGFVAHVASFREITVMDIRPHDMPIANVSFIQADLMQPPTALIGRFDSMSCLHTLEHFGLGRYGDPINPDGYLAGLANMARLLAPGATFYLSVPIGRERVEFNAHRVFAPTRIVQIAAQNGLALSELHFVDPKGRITAWDKTDQQLEEVSAVAYALGVFVFGKVPLGSSSTV